MEYEHVTLLRGKIVYALANANHSNKCNELKHTVISIFLGNMLCFIVHHTNEVNKVLLFWEVDTTKP